MSDLVFYLGVVLLGLVILGAVFSLTPVWDKLFKKQPTTEPSSSSSVFKSNYDKVIKIKEQEPSKRFPLLPDIIMNVCCIMILVWAISLLVIDRGVVQFDLTWIGFLLLFIALPIYFLVDTFIFVPKRYKLGKSWVATPDRTIIINDNVDAVFNACLEALDVMKTSIIIMNRPKLVKVRCRKSIINVTTGSIKEGDTKIVINSDSQWVTTKIDFGINRKNVDTFDSLIKKHYEQKQRETHIVKG